MENEKTEKVSLGTGDSSTPGAVFEHFFSKVPVPEKKEAKATTKKEGKEDEGAGEPTKSTAGEGEAQGKKEGEKETGSEDVSDEGESSEDDVGEDKDAEETDEVEEGSDDYVFKLPDGETVTVPRAAVLAMKEGEEEKEFKLDDVASKFRANLNAEGEIAKTKETEKKVLLERKRLEAVAGEYKKLDEVINKAFKDFQEGKGLEAFHDLVMMSGKYENPIEWEIEHIKGMFPLIKELSEMTPEQQNALVNERKLSYHDKRERERIEREKSGKTASAMDVEIKTVRAELGATDDNYWFRSLEMLKAAKDANKLQHYNITEVTPRVAAEIAVTLKATDRAEQGLSKAAPKLKEKAGEAYLELRDRLVEALKNYDISDSELEATIQEAVAAQSLDAEDEEDKKALQKKLTAKPAMQQKKPSQKKEKRLPRSFAEVDNLINELRSS